jgi:hypothetical protein
MCTALSATDAATAQRADETLEILPDDVVVVVKVVGTFCLEVTLAVWCARRAKERASCRNAPSSLVTSAASGWEAGVERIRLRQGHDTVI